MCEYSFKNKITLIKHMRKIHEVGNCDKCSAQFKQSMKLLKHMEECQEKGITISYVMMGVVSV